MFDGHLIFINSDHFAYLNCFFTFQPSSLKMKEKLHKVGRAARCFLSTRIFRRHPAVQRCEINLQGFDDTDSVERLILVVGQRRSVAETVHMSFPAFFETNHVTVPQFLLPIKSGETMTVSVYGVTGQASGQFPGFSEVLISGVCTVQSGKSCKLYIHLTN